MPLLLAVLVLLLSATPAAAQSPIADAADAVQSDPVYVDPDAEEALSEAEQQELRDRIQERDAGPMYIAVLPGSALNATGGDADQAVAEFGRAVERPGTYVVVAGNTFRAGSTDVEAGVTPDAARAAIEGGNGDLQVILLDFIDRMGAARAGDVDAATEGAPGEDGGGGGGGGALLLVGALAVGGGVFVLNRRKRGRAQRAQFEEARENVRDDLVALGDDIRALDIDVELPNTPQPVKDDYHVAVAAYERAENTWERARTPEDLAPVGEALEEGRWAMASAKARMEGREPPERRPPCFFDPRHGPSSRDVEWSPPYGEPRLVPACEADAQRVERGDDPQAREIVVGGQRTPYWNAGPMYAPYAGGFFGGFGGGLLPGLLMGSMLGSMMAPTVVYGAGDGWDGGDVGGGDFGGGDFGGGDFGGGDFGGGDFGGGDF
jgi:hypothetical protein